LKGPFDVNAEMFARLRELQDQASKMAGEILPMAQNDKLMPLEPEGGKPTALPDAELAA
jgi:hypothetical protein